MKTDAIKGKWALVTGASSGFGADFARELAALGCNLVITARRAERLAALKEEIVQNYERSVLEIPMDLAAPDAPQELFNWIKSQKIVVDILINNAGFGLYGEFIELDWERQKEMIQLNTLALSHLTWLFVHPMVDRHFGYILHTASNSAYQPSPMFAAYGASKSFVLNFSEALHEELRGTGVKCTAISPGPVVTEFQKVAGQNEDHPYVRLNQMPSKKVARIGIKAMLKGRSSVIPGWNIALIAWLSQRAPRRWTTAVTGWMMRLG